MNKIIKLTEADLKRIVKKVIKVQHEDMIVTILKMVTHQNL